MGCSYKVIQLMIFINCILVTQVEAKECRRIGIGGCNSNISGFSLLFRENPNSISKSDLTNSENNAIKERTLFNNFGQKVIVQMNSNSTNSDIVTRLIIRCVKNNTSAMFEFPGYEMSDIREFSEIVFQINGGQENILELSLAKNKSMLGVWLGFRAVPFIKKLIGNDSLTILATAKNGTDITANFDISALNSEISILRKACDW